ncbi:hypothetical protein QAD02_001567 [Eretmocerus hayati]|uniref:Uncharacterized protein n=1 Tax=Eretmocerus hayati TaxID=131215 RepID=A0ACC2NHN3_9HYME|nr:hypothetical protein QAD02_001567 [Eretmocerus hayati]
MARRREEGSRLLQQQAAHSEQSLIVFENNEVEPSAQKGQNLHNGNVHSNQLTDGTGSRSLPNPHGENGASGSQNSHHHLGASTPRSNSVAEINLAGSGNPHAPHVNAVKTGNSNLTTTQRHAALPFRQAIAPFGSQPQNFSSQPASHEQPTLPHSFAPVIVLANSPRVQNMAHFNGATQAAANQPFPNMNDPNIMAMFAQFVQLYNMTSANAQSNDVNSNVNDIFPSTAPSTAVRESFATRATADAPSRHFAAQQQQATRIQTNAAPTQPWNLPPAWPASADAFTRTSPQVWPTTSSAPNAHPTLNHIQYQAPAPKSAAAHATYQPSDNQKLRGLKVPPFWINRPDGWFGVLEKQFDYYDIHCEELRFSILTGYLEEHLITVEVDNVITNGPPHRRYSAVKEKLIEMLTGTPDVRYRKLVKGTLSDKQLPSQLLQEMLRLGSPLDQSFIRSLWLAKLPVRVQMVLASSHNQPLMEAAKSADIAWEVEQQEPSHAAAKMQVSAVDAGAAATAEVSTPILELQKQVKYLTRELKSLRSRIVKGLLAPASICGIKVYDVNSVNPKVPAPLPDTPPQQPAVSPDLQQAGPSSRDGRAHIRQYPAKKEENPHDKSDRKCCVLLK